MLTVTYKPIYVDCYHAVCHYAECHYAECQYAECHYAECRGAISYVIQQNYFECIFAVTESSVFKHPSLIFAIKPFQRAANMFLIS
jgi:hypothetical protein